MDDSMVIREPGNEYRWNPFAKLQVLAISSGKGGVGKTNVVTNLAAALGKVGKRVVVLDADISLGNVDVLLGLVPEFTMEHVLAGLRGTGPLLTGVGSGDCSGALIRRSAIRSRVTASRSSGTRCPALKYDNGNPV